MSILSVERLFFMSACHGIFPEFCEGYRSGLTDNEPFKPVQCYYKICHDNVVLLRHLGKRSVPTHSKYVASAVSVFLNRNIHHCLAYVLHSLFQYNLKNI